MKRVYFFEQTPHITAYGHIEMFIDKNNQVACAHIKKENALLTLRKVDNDTHRSFSLVTIEYTLATCNHLCYKHSLIISKRRQKFCSATLTRQFKLEEDDFEILSKNIPHPFF